MDVDFLNDDKKNTIQARSVPSMNQSFYNENLSSRTVREIGFNFSTFLNGLKNSLNNLLSTHDTILYDEFKRMEKNFPKRNLHTFQSSDYLEETKNMSESLTGLRKSLSRKIKVAEMELDYKKKRVGKQFSDAVKYAKVENRRALKELRLCAEYRDIIKHAFETIVNNLNEEIKLNIKNELTGKTVVSPRKSLDANLVSMNLTIKRLTSIGSKKIIPATTDLSYSSPNRIWVNNQNLSLTPNVLKSSPKELNNSIKKQKNLNNFILKKASNIDS